MSRGPWRERARFEGLPFPFTMRELEEAEAHDPGFDERNEEELRIAIDRSPERRDLERRLLPFREEPQRRGPARTRIAPFRPRREDGPAAGTSACSEARAKP